MVFNQAVFTCIVFFQYATVVKLFHESAEVIEITVKCCFVVYNLIYKIVQTPSSLDAIYCSQ